MPHARQTCPIKSRMQAVNGRRDLELLRPVNLWLSQCVFVLPHKRFILFLFSFCVGVDNKAYVVSIHLPLVSWERQLTLLQRWQEADRLSHTILVV